jgi:hypothetical protein
MRSMAPPAPFSISPTAPRSRVGTSWIAAAGRPASSSPSTRQAWMAAELRCVSEPPRRITALPAFRHRAPASAVTFGRLSKMTPTTPIGVRTRWIARPFGRCHSAMIWPTGSGSSAIASRPAAIASMRSGVRVPRSMTAEVASAACKPAISRALASRMALVAARSRAAALRNAWFFTALSALAMRVAASRARAPMSATMSATSPSPLLATARVLVLLIDSGAPGRRGGPSRRGRGSRGWLRSRPSGGR